MSFLFVFQNDNDLIDNDNAGQSPAAQAVVLTFSLTYYLTYYYLILLTLFYFSFGCTICVRILITRPFCIKSVLQKFPRSLYLYSNIFIKIIHYTIRKEANLLQHIIHFFFSKVTLFTVQFFLFHSSHTSRGTHDGFKKNALRIYKVSHVRFTNFYNLQNFFLSK